MRESCPISLTSTGSLKALAEYKALSKRCAIHLNVTDLFWLQINKDVRIDRQVLHAFKKL